jgi:hypothetical protein
MQTKLPKRRGRSVIALRGALGIGRNCSKRPKSNPGEYVGDS